MATQGSETLTTNGGAEPHLNGYGDNNSSPLENPNRSIGGTTNAMYHLNTNGGVDTTAEPQLTYTVVDKSDEEGVPVHTGEDSITDNDGTSAAEDEETGSTEDDPLKLFVGQVPKQMSEEDIFPTFDAFGPLKDVAIIRDKHTGSHRGCAFVTYWSSVDALKAQAALHDQFIFEGGKRAAQVKPAEPSVPENKLFIGMLSRAATEEIVRELFEGYGQIREIHMIRSSDGTSRCAAFLRYVEREAAVQAIANLNGTIVMEGAARPLIVKFADNKHQRQQRHIRNTRKQDIISVGGHSVSVGGHSVGPSPPNSSPPYPPGSSSPYPQQYAPPPPGHMAPPMHHQPGSASPHPYQNMPPPHQYNHHHHPHAPHSPYTPHPYAHHHHPAHMYSHQQHHGQPHPGYVPHQGVPPYAPLPPPQHQQAAMDSDGTPRLSEGPAGANLFVYHLPHDLTDADLATAFNAFGNVISAKVYVDKYTGESKGFGFVSYDSVISAEAAIEQMNGFTIGNKRLKVQHKRVHGMNPNLPVHRSTPTT